MVTIFDYPAKADSTDSIYFIDAGLIIYSPVNTTYSYNGLFLNLRLYSAGILGGLDPQIAIIYSIDNTFNGSVPLSSNGEMHLMTRAVGMIVLPELPNGSHTLTIYLYGLNQRAYEPKYFSFNLAVYFSTAGNPNLTPTTNPIPALTPTPTPTITPTTTPTSTATPQPTTTAQLPTASPTPTSTATSLDPTSTPTLTPSPSIPEFPAWVILPLILATFVFARIWHKNKLTRYIKTRR
jgi:hypothetical protein